MSETNLVENTPAPDNNKLEIKLFTLNLLRETFPNMDESEIETTADDLMSKAYTEVERKERCKSEANVPNTITSPTTSKRHQQIEVDYMQMHSMGPRRLLRGYNNGNSRFAYKYRPYNWYNVQMINRRYCKQMKKFPTFSKSCNKYHRNTQYCLPESEFIM